MNSDLRGQAAELGREIDGLRQEGQLSKRVAALGQQILKLNLQQDISGLVGAYGEMAALAAAGGDVAAQALAHYGQGAALITLPDRRDECRGAFQQAAELGAAAEHHSVAAKAQHALAALAAEDGDIAAATAHQTRALEHVDESREPELAVQIYRSRATLYWAALALDSARADLDSALALASLMGRADGGRLRREIEAEQTMLRAFQRPDATLEDQMDALARLGRRGQTSGPATAAEAALRRAQAAARRQNFAAVAARAEEACAEALRSTDTLRIVHYLAACVLLAGARSRLGDRPGALASLLTCKGTLERELGKEAGQQIIPILNALVEPWGQAGLQEALTTYRARLHEAQHPS